MPPSNDPEREEQPQTPGPGMELVGFCTGYVRPYGYSGRGENRELKAWGRIRKD